EVSFRCGGIKLLNLAELEDGQIGYSVTPDGKSLCSGEAGAWDPNWLVIGHETACGDPISSTLAPLHCRYSHPFMPKARGNPSKSHPHSGPLRSVSRSSRAFRSGAATPWSTTAIRSAKWSGQTFYTELHKQTTPAPRRSSGMSSWNPEFNEW